MTLPSKYNDIRAYLNDAFRFLTDYQWLYNYPNTRILCLGILEKFPTEWKHYFKTLIGNEIMSLFFGNPKNDVPLSLVETLEVIEDLKPQESTVIDKCDHKFPTNSGLKAKKIHEILALAPLIDQVCKKSNCDYIVDVGAGLGYLSELLSVKYKYKVLAIEGSQEKIDLSRIDRTNVEYFHHFITEFSVENIENLLKTRSESYAICGLHACADLSVTIMKIFAQLENAKALILMPCCYHRMEMATENSYKHFPASELMKEFFLQYDARTFLNGSFLRLACQEVVAGLDEKERDKRTKNLLYRAILQKVAENGGYGLVRLKRRTTGSQTYDFDEYLANLERTHTLTCDGGKRKTPINEDVNFLGCMRKMWKQYVDDECMVDALMGFQAKLQGLCENIVLLDRVLLLREMGIECRSVKVTDEQVSPRCHAIIATKV